MFDEILNLIEEKKYDLAEEKLNSIIKNTDIEEKDKAKAHYFIGYINT